MYNTFNEKEYIREFSSKQDQVLLWLEKQTHLRTNHARMLCGEYEGKLLEFLSGMIRPNRILEIGAFTGYSSICLARGLKAGGILDSLEINDELEDLILEAYKRAGLQDVIRLHIGDAMDTIETLKMQGAKYDLVFIDANKREYSSYYQHIFDMLTPDAYIVADNVLWDGKVYQPKPASDAQTVGIMEFNRLVASDSRVENIILPIRDGLNIIRRLR